MSALDRDFLIGLYESTRDDELSQIEWPEGVRDAFVRMQFEAQDTDYRRNNPVGSFELIEVDGRPAGRLIVDRRRDEVRIVDISLLPEHRGNGIGTCLISALQDEAASTGRTLTIHVEVHNPAIVLYTRLGFRPLSEHGLYRLMRWSAS